MINFKSLVPSLNSTQQKLARTRQNELQESLTEIFYTIFHKTIYELLKLLQCLDR